MEEDTKKSLMNQAGRFMQGTFLSRVTGLIREMLMTYCFGANPSVGSFYVAFRLANFFRRFLGEGALLSGFIPHFEEIRLVSKEKAAKFFQDLAFSLLIFFFFFLLILETGLYFFSLSAKESTQEILLLTMIMLPSLFFLSLHTQGSAVLQCEKKYFLSAISPVFLNIVWILTIFFLKDKEVKEAIIPLSFGILVGYIAQMLVVWKQAVRSLFSKGSFSFFSGTFFSEEIKKMLPGFSLGILGVGAQQINSALDVFFARWCLLEGPAYLNYAIRLQQLPLALFSIAIASALLPSLSRVNREENVQKYAELLGHGLKKTLDLIMPITAIFLILGPHLVQLLYGRGQFSFLDAKETTKCFWGYSLGLLPMSFSILLASSFFSKKNYLTPSLGSILSVGLNFFLNLIFIVFFQNQVSLLALASSIVSFFQVLFLWKKIPKKIKGSIHLYSKLMFSFGFSLLASFGTLCFESFFFSEKKAGYLLFQNELTFTKTFFPLVFEIGCLLCFFFGVYFFLVFLKSYFERKQNLEYA